MEKFQSLEFMMILVGRIAISAVCGALIGYERRRRQKEAGIRTHVMVAIGAALFAIVSKYGYMDVVVIDSIQLDASRIAANLVTGVSFLGAGMIFVRSRSITGLTTAAGIWTVSGVGLAFGAGMYIIGLAATVFVVIIQFVLHNPIARLEGASAKEITFVLSDKDKAEELVAEMQQYDPRAYVNACEFKDNDTMVLKCTVRVNQGEILSDTLGFVKRHEYLKSISIN